MAGKKLNADYKMQIFSSTVKCIQSEPAGADVMRCQNLTKAIIVEDKL